MIQTHQTPRGMPDIYLHGLEVAISGLVQGWCPKGGNCLIYKERLISSQIELPTIFARLVEKHLLFQDGSGRGTVYFLEEARLDDAFEAFNSSGGLGGSSGGLPESSGGLAQGSGGLEALRSIAEPVSSTKKAPKPLVEKVILDLCAEQPCTLELLTDLLQRSEGVVRKDYLQPMIKDKRLRYQYPTMLNHPGQAYITNREGDA